MININPAYVDKDSEEESDYSIKNQINFDENRNSEILKIKSDLTPTKEVTKINRNYG